MFSNILQGSSDSAVQHPCHQSLLVLIGLKLKSYLHDGRLSSIQCSLQKFAAIIASIENISTQKQKLDEYIEYMEYIFLNAMNLSACLYGV